ncbi:MAG: hypothetical protein ACKOJF_04020, partial [Planctomycetaceae bacterium]
MQHVQAVVVNEGNLSRRGVLRGVISGRPVAVQQLGQLDVQPADTALLGPGWTFCQVPDFTERQVIRFLDHGAHPGESRSTHQVCFNSSQLRG